MTYRELLAELKGFSDEQLDCNLTIYDTYEDEYSPAKLKIEENHNTLDPNYPVFTISVFIL